jgi:hypothetical protein
MTLPNVIEHLQLFEHLKKPRAARREILKALTDNAFHSRRRSFLRWKDEFCVSGEPPNEIGPPDVPPRGQEWGRAKIRWAAGKVLDPYGAAQNGKWRPAWRIVWLARSKVTELWPPSPDSPAPGEANATNVVPFTGRKRGPKSGKFQSIVDAIKSDLAAGHLTMEALCQMCDKDLVSKYGQQFDSKRTVCREARDRVVSEFDGISNSVK